MNNKYYILATPCTGKTTYIKENKERLKERNVHIYDMDDFDSPNQSTEQLFKQLNTKNKNILHIILGINHKLKKEICEYVSVIMPTKKLKENVEIRITKNPNIIKGKVILTFANEEKVLNYHDKIKKLQIKKI